VRAPTEKVLDLLRAGEIELLGLMPNASNYTFAAAVTDGDRRVVAVYKPRDGETPLWDFPEGTLYAREAAAYEVSVAMGWDLVPPTVVRDGPHGIGSVQLFVDAEPGAHFLTLMPEHAADFRRVAAFDVVTNNADRKSGHCMLERDTGTIFVIDHGVCFHVQPKLRTVIWDFAGEQLSPDVVDGLARLRDALAGPLRSRIEQLLSPSEVDTLMTRTRAMLDGGSFPDVPLDRRPYPWPPV